jgi:PX domain-containing protein kinase-like protein
MLLKFLQLFSKKDEVNIPYFKKKNTILTLNKLMNSSPSTESLLDSILTRDAFKQAMPTLDQLCAHHFFTEYARNFNESHALAIHNIKPHLKLSTNAKEQIKIAILKTESRLRDEQKSVKNQKRLVRVQELMTSEEGKKKEKQRAVS